MGHNEFAIDVLTQEETCKDEFGSGYDELLNAYMQAKPSIIKIDPINQSVKITKVFDQLDHIIHDEEFYDEKKYPRKWLILNLREVNEKIIVKRLQAILIYLLRGELSFAMNKPLIGSSIAASKCAMNDMSQAEYLVHDLYIASLIRDNGNKFSLIEPQMNAQIFEGHKFNWDYLFYILSYLVKISKARIYKEIYFPENALDNYLTALRLFESRDQLNHSKAKLLCPVIINSYFEASKLLFDKGKIIESLSYQLDAMYIIMEASCLVKKNNSINIAKNKIRKANNILKSFKGYFIEYFKKEIVLSLFIPKKCIDEFYKLLNKFNAIEIRPIFLQDGRLINPAIFNKFIEDLLPCLKPILSDLLARIGFTLFTIRNRIQIEKLDLAMKEKLTINNLGKEIESFQKNINEEIVQYLNGLKGFLPELGKYTSIVMGYAVDFTSKKIERVLCSSALAEINEQKEDPPIKNICRTMARHSLANIGNIASIPLQVSQYLMQGCYKLRTKAHPFKRGLLNKLVILRRWQSFNPRVPRPKGQDIRGGGYFLFWEGNGIVIDPGFNFLQNFYEEGFSIEDIDAVVISHAHPDHDDELNSILTMLAEWNKYQEMAEYIAKDAQPYTKKTIDLFLNEGAYRKYNNWLYAKNVMIGKIFILQSNQWDKRSEEKNTYEKKFGDNPVIDLRERYHFKLIVTPSWHNELIDKHSSVGMIFCLYKNGNKDDIAFKIGITGDTEWYDKIEETYCEVDILIAHLGDIKFRELLSHLDATSTIFSRFIRSWFKVDGLTDDEALTILREYLLHRDIYGLDEDYLEDDIKKTKKEQYQHIKTMKKDKKKWELALVNYCIPTGQYTYKNHLGIKGLYELFNALVIKNDQDHQKLMVVGELPEELQSYRHLLACILEEQEPSKKVRCLTGDIGLSIGLPTNKFEFGRPDGKKPRFAVRCLRCNQNNDYVKGDEKNGTTYLYHYHAIDVIQESCLRARQSRIVWFCKDHSANPDYARLEYFVEPDLRTVWG